RIKRAIIGRNNQNVGLRPIGIGYTDTEPRQHDPRRFEFTLQVTEGNNEILDKSLMEPAWRCVQDRLPLDQLPFLFVRPRVREGVELLPRHWSGVDDWDAHHERAPKFSALDQHRSAALWPFAFAQDAEALGDLRICLEQSAEIAAEAVLVELLARLDVPQPT